jgi:hypothetical protein
VTAQLGAAERAAEKAEAAASAARMAMYEAGDRTTFDRAAAAASQAGAKADAARKRVEQIRRQNGLKPGVARGELKLAIATMRKAERAKQRHRAAVERADQLVAQAETLLAEAQAETKKAREVDVAAKTKAAKTAGTTPATSPAMRDARLVQETAADNVEAPRLPATVSRTSFRTRRPPARGRARSWSERLTAC